MHEYSQLPRPGGGVKSLTHPKPWHFLDFPTSPSHWAREVCPSDSSSFLSEDRRGSRGDLKETRLAELVDRQEIQTATRQVREGKDSQKESKEGWRGREKLHKKDLARQGVPTGKSRRRTTMSDIKIHEKRVQNGRIYRETWADLVIYGYVATIVTEQRNMQQKKKKCNHVLFLQSHTT